MLVGQARTEATRHEQKRTQVAEKIASLSAMPHTSPTELAEVSGQLVTLTRRAAVMESQVDVLEGKHKALTRYRDALARYASGLDGLSQPAGLAGLRDGPAADGHWTG